jgi:hypothetical protein
LGLLFGGLTVLSSRFAKLTGFAIRSNIPIGSELPFPMKFPCLEDMIMLPAILGAFYEILHKNLYNQSAAAL